MIKYLILMILAFSSTANAQCLKFDNFQMANVSLNRFSGSFVTSLGRDPNILILSDSILNSTQLKDRLIEDYPDAIIEILGFGGSPSTMGLLLAASDVQAYTAGENILTTTDLSSWTATNVAVSSGSVFPDRGLACYKVTGNGTTSQNIALGSIACPSGVTELTFSILIHPGEAHSAKLEIYNETTTTSLESLELTFDDLSNLTRRYSVTATSGISGGDNLAARVFIEPKHPANYIYAARPILSIGELSPEYTATSGTGETPTSKGWTALAGDGLDLSIFDLAVISYGRNDSQASSLAGATDYATQLSAIINGIATHVERVLVVTPPPYANSGLTAWVSDPYDDDGFYAAAAQTASERGVGYYDAISDYKALTDAGTYTVAQLMNDTVHPSRSFKSADGIERYRLAICNYLQSASSTQPIVGSTTSTARLIGEASGSWTWASDATSTDSPAWIYSGKAKTDWSMKSSNVGASLTFSTTGTMIGLVAIVDAATAGEVDISVDGGAATRIDTQVTGQTDYPMAFFVCGGLSDGPHSVVVTVVSGTVRIIGIVSA